MQYTSNATLFVRGVILCLGSLLTLWSCPALADSTAQPAGLSSPIQIMNAVMDRGTGDRRSSHIQLTISDSSGVRIRSIEVRAARSADLFKTLIVVNAPADLQGTAFLSLDYRNPDRSDERWLYLPGLKRTTRVATGQLSNSFLGSDFSYADLSPPDASKFNFVIQENSAVVDGETCWLIVATPKTRQDAESVGYAKAEFWVSKDKLALVRVRSTLIDGKRIKYSKASKFQKVGSGWIAARVEARTVSDGKVLSETVLEIGNVRDGDASITDADFTKQRLERGL